jgi:GH15 family glucan-1,4-alpha-glucosidase
MSTGTGRLGGATSGTGGLLAGRYERRNLVETSVRAILSNQQPNGALAASPDFPQYHYCWLRDGSFVAHALDRAGELDASARFHDWVKRALDGVAPAMEAAVAQSRAGTRLDPAVMSPARFSLAGVAVADDWPNFQIDGYGIWLWALRSHLAAAGTKRLDGQTAGAVERTARYLDALALSPCFDVWEEDGKSVHTSTLACVYGGLVAAAEMLDDRELAARAAEVRGIVLEQGESDGRFAKSSASHEVDASLLWLSEPFGLVGPTDAVFARTAADIARELNFEGGLRRYPGDTYYGGGSWALLTASLGWHYAVLGDLTAARRQLEWIAARYDGDGHLGEQFGGERRDPEHHAYWVARWGPPARELLWSHAMLVVLSNEIALAAARDAGPSQERS